MRFTFVDCASYCSVRVTVSHLASSDLAGPKSPRFDSGESGRAQSATSCLCCLCLMIVPPISLFIYSSEHPYGLVPCRSYPRCLAFMVRASTTLPPGWGSSRYATKCVSQVEVASTIGKWNKRRAPTNLSLSCVLVSCRVFDWVFGCLKVCHLISGCFSLFCYCVSLFNFSCYEHCCSSGVLSSPVCDLQGPGRQVLFPLTCPINPIYATKTSLKLSCLPPVVQRVVVGYALTAQSPKLRCFETGEAPVQRRCYVDPLFVFQKS